MATLDRKFLDLTPEQTTLKILDAAVISGCKSPESQDYYHIITAIEDRFAWITTEEFLLAFRLNSYGEYRQKVEHFNLFSMDYVVAVLNKYTQHRAEAVLKSEAEADKIRAEMNKKPTPEQEHESRINTLEIIKKDFEAFKINPSHEISVAAAKYDILQRLKMVPVLSEEQKQNYMALAKQKRIAQIKSQVNAKNAESAVQLRNLKTLLENYNTGSIHSVEQGMIKSLAKELALIDWFSRLSAFPDFSGSFY